MGFNPERLRIPVLKRRVPSVLRRMARLSTRNGFLLRRAGGSVLLLNPDNFVDRHLAFYGEFESRQLDWFTARMRAAGCDIFVDVGANIGLYCLRVAQQDLARRILAFEPDERNRQQLGANILLNGLTGRIEIRAEAVSAAAGTAGFHLAAASSTGRSRIDAGAGTEVPTVALDEAVPLRGGTAFVKMDIEGHEIPAVQGMAALVAGNRVLLQVEAAEANVPPLTALLAAMGMRHLHRIGEDHWFANFEPG